MTNIINIKNLNLVVSNNHKLINQISLIHFHNLPSSFFTTSGFKFVLFFSKWFKQSIKSFKLDYDIWTGDPVEISVAERN